MRDLWTVAEVVAATGGHPEGLSDGAINSISIDSRDVGHEALFVAIKGDRLDGHDFVKTALDAGAQAAIVSEAWYAAHRGDRLIVVPDTLAALNAMAVAARNRTRAKIVAVTGSAGKTTTKEAIRVALQSAGATHASIKSFNNHWGVPLMLARMPRESQFGVFEIGMNHAGEITPLSKLVRPHIVVITTVAAAHLEFFKSVTEIAEAKAEIFLGLEQGGAAVLNADHEYLHVLFQKARQAKVGKIVTYGFDESADWHIETVGMAGLRSIAHVAHGEVQLDLNLQVPGRHVVANAVAALAVSELAGAVLQLVNSALSRMAAPEGRGATVSLGSDKKPLLLVDESYNANVASMNAAMDVFAHVAAPGGEKVLILGDMLELGPQGPELHRSLKDSVLGTGATRIFLVGKAIEPLGEALGEAHVTGAARRIEEIAPAILASLAYGDAVMVKGSNGVRLGTLVEMIRQKFRAAA
ncbi:MAG: UDP-N-acetylmuramoyl-tripeptide--D-alanyl-D-alanine ligase [Devosia sp.]